MIPGLTTKISEVAVALTTQIDASADLLRVTDTTASTTVATIVPKFGGGFSGITLIHNGSGATIATLTTGNILTAVDIASNKLVVLAYSKALGKYIVGSTT